jgi:thiol-disulfide isomerase/thioredoxin
VTVIALLCRLVLAGTFVISAIGKLRDRAGARQAVQDFGLPKRLIAPIAGALPLVELVIATLLVLADPSATIGSIAALALLAAFTVTVVANLLRGNQVDCHCFGQLTGGPAGWRSVVRNGALLVVAGLPLAEAGDLRSLPAAADDYSAGELGVAAALGVLTAVVIALGALLQTLVRRYGSVLLRLEALESYVGLAAPSPAPDFALPDLDGELLALADVVALGKPALIAFVAPTCHLCSEILPDLERWQSESEHAVSVVVVSTGSVQDNRDKIGAASRLRVLLQDGRSLEADYGVTGTPAAVLVGVDASLVGAVSYGVDAVRALHDNVVRTLAAAQGGPDHDVHQIQPRPVTVGDELPELSAAIDGRASQPIATLTREEQVLVFWRFDCSFCEQIAKDVAALEGEARLLLVTGSATEAIRATGLRSPILREQNGELTAALQVPGTPAAVAIRGGVVTSDVALGGPDVLALIERSRTTAASAV